MPVAIVRRENCLVQCIHQRTGAKVWGYEKKHKGHTYRKTGFHSRAAAAKALDLLVLRLLGAKSGQEAVTFAELVWAYLEDAKARGVSGPTLQDSSRIAKRFSAVLPDRDRAYLEVITSERLRTYRAERLEAGLHPHSVQYELKRLNSILRSATRLFEQRAGDWKPPAVPSVKAIHTGRAVTLSDEQIQRLLAAADGDTRDLIVLGLHTALRVNELLQLRRQAVDFTPGIDSEHGRLFILSAKTKQHATLPLTSYAAEVLRRRLAKSDRAFSMPYHAARRRFKAACKRAGISYGIGDERGVVIHTLRHSAATYLANAGVPLNVLKAITRHSTTQMVLRYAHPTAEAVGEAVRKLDKISR